MRKNACCGVVGQSRAVKTTLMKDTTAEFDVIHPPDVIEKYAPLRSLVLWEKGSGRWATRRMVPPREDT